MTLDNVLMMPIPHLPKLLAPKSPPLSPNQKKVRTAKRSHMFPNDFVGHPLELENRGNVAHKVWRSESCLASAHMHVSTPIHPMTAPLWYTIRSRQSRFVVVKSQWFAISRLRQPHFLCGMMARVSYCQLNRHPFGHLIR